MLEGKKGINGLLLLKVIGGWIITLVVVAITAALFYAQGVYAPSQYNLDSIQRYEAGINSALNSVAKDALDAATQGTVKSTTAGFEQDKQDDSGKQIAFMEEILFKVVEKCHS